MQIEMTDEQVDVLESIYFFEGQDYKERLARRYQFNEQFLYIEDVMEKRGIKFVTEKVRQNCDNIHVSVKGDPDEVAWMDMALLVYAHQKKFKHLVVLEHFPDVQL